MNKGRGKGVKEVAQLIKERKEKKRLKSERLIANLEKAEQAKEKFLQKESHENSEKSETARPAPLRQNTISIALPCSVMDNCQSLDLKCYLAATVARCAALFNVDEVVVFNDTKAVIPVTPDGDYVFMGKRSHSALTLASMMQYMECPPHLRKFFFPENKKELELAARMNPLNIPHHNLDITSFREGVVSNRTEPGKGSYVNVGLYREVLVDRLLEPGIRVTVEMTPTEAGQRVPRGAVVSPSKPRLESSLYWGYSVRLANNFSEVFNRSPFSEEYDLIIGTSENGASVDDVKLKPFKHALIVFGGLRGLEAILEDDETFSGSTDVSTLFHVYLNTCPGQGSRTIRTEEALFISLATLQGKFS